MPTWAVEARVTLVIDAQNSNEALRLAQQSVQSALWVEQCRFSRLWEVDYVDYVDEETVDPGAPYGGRLDRRVRG